MNAVGWIAPHSGDLVRALQASLRGEGLDPPFLPMHDEAPGSRAHDLRRLDRVRGGAGVTRRRPDPSSAG